MAETRTPDFEEPPVVETVLGIEFTPLEEWSLPHFGLYWTEIRDKYKQVDVQPPLASTIEHFGPEQRPAQVPTFELIGDPASTARCWFVDETERRLLQVQNGRFILNWRKVQEADVYPHYPALRKDLLDEWKRFGDFLAKNNLGQPRVVQCEVTYVNHLIQGKGWRTFGDLPNVIPSWSGEHSDDFLPKQEAVALNVRYLMPQNRGRLHVALQRAIRKTDAQEIIQLNLTARGAPRSSTEEDMIAWLDLGRDWVVRGFTSFTSRAMHAIWRRKQ